MKFLKTARLTSLDSVASRSEMILISIGLCWLAASTKNSSTTSVKVRAAAHCKRAIVWIAKCTRMRATRCSAIGEKAPRRAHRLEPKSKSDWNTCALRRSSYKLAMWTRLTFIWAILSARHIIVLRYHESKMIISNFVRALYLRSHELNDFHFHTGRRWQVIRSSVLWKA